MQQGNNATSYKYMQLANQLDPDYEQNLVNMAVWYHNNNLPDRARKCLEHLLKKHPANETAKAMLASLLNPQTK